MSDMEERTFSLHAEDAALIDQLVASGTYTSASEVIGAGLRALREGDASVERWLRKEAIDRIRADHAARVKRRQVRSVPQVRPRIAAPLPFR